MKLPPAHAQVRMTGRFLAPQAVEELSAGHRRPPTRHRRAGQPRPAPDLNSHVPCQTLVIPPSITTADPVWYVISPRNMKRTVSAISRGCAYRPTAMPDPTRPRPQAGPPGL